MGKVHKNRSAQVIELHQGMNKKLSEPQPVPRKKPTLSRYPATPSQIYLMRRITGMTQKQMAKELEVSIRTYCRWETGETKMPKVYHTWLKQLSVGTEFGGPDWKGFYFKDGYLYTDSDYRYTAGQIRAIFMNKQLIHTLEKKVERLESEIENLNKQMTGVEAREVDKDLVRDIDAAMDKFYRWHRDRGTFAEY